MINLLYRALFFWLGAFETLFTYKGWHGLSWLGRVVPRWLLLPLSFGLLASGKRRWRWRIVSLALTAPLGLALQVTLSSLHHWVLNPLLRLQPGRYEDRTITRFDIDMREGYLPALYVVPRQGAKTGICVVHGSGCDKTFYVWRLVDLLIARSVAVLLIDLDGHGENPRPQRFPEMMEDVAVGVEWLRVRHERVGVLGISLGGCLAARAVADGVVVDGLAILEAPPQLQFTRGDVRREAFALARPYLLELFGDCTVYHMIRAWQSAPIRAAIGTWDLIAALDLEGSLPRIDAPLLLVYGASDAIVKPAQAEQARRAAPAGATFALIPGASHLTLILTPKALRTIDEWVARVLGDKE